eukprot:jgi/Phyca11/116542/e_gw1.31.553.1
MLATTACASVSPRQIHDEKSRKHRRCIVCRWEGRYSTEVTNYCLTHDMCLCRVLHDQPAEPWMYPSTTYTCWNKFHQFYLPNGLFTDKRNERRHSDLAKLRDYTKSQKGLPGRLHTGSAATGSAQIILSASMHSECHAQTCHLQWVWYM